MSSASTIIEPLTECFVLAVLGAYVLLHFFSLSPWLTVPIHLLTWLSLDCVIFYTLAHSSPSPSRHRPAPHDGPGIDFVKAWFVREALALPIWAFAMLGNEVGWRDNGQTYKVQRDGSVRLAGEGEGRGIAETLFSKVAVRLGDRRGYVTLSPDEENH